MADDKKITQLDPRNPAAADDYLVIVNNDATPVTQRIDIDQLFASPQPIGSSNASTGLFTTLALSIDSTAVINEFSTDGTLADDSDTAVPTEKAVKTYVDAHTGQVTPGTDEAIVRYDGTSQVQASGIFIDDLNNVTGVNNLDATTVTCTDLYVDGELSLAFGATVNEFSIDGTLGGDSDDAVPTEKAVKTYVDSKIGGSIGPGIDEAIVRYDGTSSVQVSGIFIDDLNNVTGINTLDATTVICTDLYVDGELSLALGTTINEFSTDGTLVDDSDDAVPTEQAVKTYVDNAISSLNPNKIWQDDSYVEVVDDGTTSGYVSIVTDGIEVGHFDENGLQMFQIGATVNEFSIDGTLSGNSDTALPTEKAVKAYVDSQIHNEMNVQSISSDSTAINNDALLVDTTAGIVNISLILSANAKIIIKKITTDSNTVVVTVPGGLIDGDPSVTVDSTNKAFTFISDGINFYLV